MRVANLMAVLALVAPVMTAAQQQEQGQQQTQQLQQQQQQPSESDQQGSSGGGDQNEDKPNPVDMKDLPEDLSQMFLLSPDERVKIRERQLQDQKANYRPLRDVESLRDMTRLDPSSADVPTVKVTPDFPSSIVFTDISGEPWPIRHLAQTGSVAEVERVDGSDNSLVFYANNHAGEKSVSVYLEGLNMPITLRIKGTDSEFHAVKSIQVTERGPKAQSAGKTGQGQGNQREDFEPAGAGGGNGEDGSDGASSGDGSKLDEVINKMAYQVTPDGFDRIEISDDNSMAWIKENDPSKLYLLTDLTISAPAPVNGASSVVSVGEGRKVYVLPRVNPVMALDESGQRQYLKFKE